jgi:hypothetical protein
VKITRHYAANRLAGFERGTVRMSARHAMPYACKRATKLSIGKVECPTVKTAASGQCASCGDGCLLMALRLVRHFDPTAEETVFFPRLQGG